MLCHGAIVRYRGTCCVETPHLLAARCLGRTPEALEDRHHYKAYPAFRLEGRIKYLGIIISYSNYELLTLRHRLAEAGKKIQLVRKYIYNRRVASPAARLRVWFATVWATAVTGLPEVGLSPESARLLRGWYAQKLRSVLNQPAHVTHVTTADLLRLHKLQDPVEKIIQRMKGRIAKLRKRSRSVTEAAADVTLHSHILIDLDRILQEAQAIPTAPQATQAPAYLKVRVG